MRRSKTIIKKVDLFHALAAFMIFSNVCIIFDLNFLYVNTLVSLFTFLFIPGLLVFLALRLKRLSLWETVVIAVGLSIAFLQFGGAFINLILPFIGVKSPLSTIPLLIGFDIIWGLLFFAAWKRMYNFTFTVPALSTIKYKKPIMYLLPLLFPILAICGAITLNNQGTNLYTMIMLALVAAYTVLLIKNYKKNELSIYPYAIFLISLSLLFSTSLRSWYVSGHDIMREFYVFNLTSTHNLWDLSLYRDAYNACLSITVLPTILNRFLLIPGPYIFKIIFQILFSICPVIIFFIIYKYTTKILAFLSVIFFMSFPTFYNDMPMLNRQEIGFIFFGLLLYVIFSKTLSMFVRRVLFILFGFSIVVSHYSTNYVTIALLVAMVVLTWLMKLKSVRLFLRRYSRVLGVKNKFKNYPLISGFAVISLILFTMFWNTLFTRTSNNIGDISNKIYNSIFISSANDSRSEDVSYSLFFSHKKSEKELLKELSDKQIKQASLNGELFSKSVTSPYPVLLLPQKTLPLTPVGEILETMHLPVTVSQAALRQLSSAFIQVSVFIGIFGIIAFRNRKYFDVQYFVLCVSGVALLAAVVVVPNLSAEYGILRLFEQLLFLLSLPVVIATSSFFSLLKEDRRILAVGIVAIIFFLSLTGFLTHFTGGYYPQLTLDNAGTYYESYYIKKEDIAAIDWFSKNQNHKVPIQSDSSGAMRLLTYGGIYADQQIFPSSILKDSYVYLPNAENSKVVVSLSGDTFLVSSPNKFLDEQKNIIYSNGSTKIYK